MEAYRGGPVFMDSLGICWTEQELAEAGGIDEVQRLADEANKI